MQALQPCEKVAEAAAGCLLGQLAAGRLQLKWAGRALWRAVFTPAA